MENEYEERLRARKMFTDIIAYNLLESFKQDKSITTCNDYECNSRDCKLFRALQDYVEYDVAFENKIGISPEFEVIKTNNK